METKRAKRGGARPGAGRPRGTSMYGEETRPVRIPLGLLADVTAMLDRYRQGRGLDPGPAGIMPVRALGSSLLLPLYESRISAGFPSPADDSIEAGLDLNAYLVKNPAATFLVRVEGDSMLGAGIHHGDVIVVDRSLEARDGKIVVAVLNGELTVKRLRYREGRPVLFSENPKYPPIPVGDDADFLVWGVVTSVLHKV